MPFKSEKQRGYMEAHRAEMVAQGVDMDEWERASKGKKLPKRKKPDGSGRSKETKFRQYVEKTSK